MVLLFWESFCELSNQKIMRILIFKAQIIKTIASSKKNIVKGFLRSFEPFYLNMPNVCIFDF